MVKIYYSDKWVTIYHGDCREILPQLNVKVDLVLTDPPYGVGLEYESYEDTPENLRNLCQGVLPTCLNISQGATVWFGSASYLQRDLQNFPIPPARILIWNVTFSNAFPCGNGILYRWQPIYTWKLPTKHDGPHIDVLSFPTEGHQGFYHPGAKPPDLICSLVGFAPTNDLILDPFLGSGTTAYCAKKLNRRCIGIEIEEKYCEIAAKRCCQEVMELKI